MDQFEASLLESEWPNNGATPIDESGERFLRKEAHALSHRGGDGLRDGHAPHSAARVSGSGSVGFRVCELSPLYKRRHKFEISPRCVRKCEFFSASVQNKVVNLKTQHNTLLTLNEKVNKLQDQLKRNEDALRQLDETAAATKLGNANGGGGVVDGGTLERQQQAQIPEPHDAASQNAAARANALARRQSTPASALKTGEATCPANSAIADVQVN